MRKLSGLRLPGSAPPLDWCQGRSDPAPDPPPGPVDVIVPVHGAPDELARCAASLLRHTDWQRHRLVLVLDGRPEPSVARVADDLERQLGNALLVLANPRRRGFVVSVNRGLRASDRDAVLLNSDTEVAAGWLDRLQAAAHSAPEVATATPFSNNATICSLPRGGEENALPAGHDVDSMAHLVEHVSERRYPRLPTGVGVCMYVKRKVLDEVGLLDEASFGLGYGEESEFCFRALAAGYVHVLDDATFIYHSGQRSFGRSRSRRVRRAHRRMRRLQPAYLPTIAHFLAEDPLAPVRRRVVSALCPNRPASPEPPRSVLHVVHGWPPYNLAGTEQYCRWLTLRQSEWRQVTVCGRIGDPDRDSGQTVELLDGGVRVRLVVNHFDQRNPLARNALRNRRLERDFARLIDEVSPDLVHVHHFSGHALGMAGVLRARRLPWVLQLQDWWTFCSRANLLHRDGHLCGGPGLQRCSACLPLTGKPPRGLWNPLLYAYRNRLAGRVLADADALIAGSRFIVNSFRHHGLLRHRTVDVLPYGVDLADRPAPSRHPPVRPLRFGCVGSLMPHKGVHVAVEAFRGIDPADAVLEVWGDLETMPAYSERLRRLAADAPVRFRGRFREEDKAQVLAGLDALVIPSIGFESFGLVAREALAVGTPVLVSQRSALAEMADADLPGASFPAGDTAALASLVHRLVAEPRRLADWAAEPRPVKGMDAHSEEIEAVYRRILAGVSNR